MKEVFLKETVKSEEMTLSTMIWRLFKRQPVGFLEATLEANQDLASKGVFTPVGTEIRFPLHEAEEKRRDDGVIRLWD